MVTARFIRILASTDVRWIGEAEKCFRFEILGCHPDLTTPEINFEAVPKPAGYLEALWSAPELIIAKNEAVRLTSQQYLVNVSHIEDSDLILDEFNVSDNGLILPKPQWDTTYTFTLECTHANLERLNCGRFEVKAIIQENDKNCLKNQPPCPLEDRIQFVKPEVIGAVSRTNGSVFVSWTDSNMGWKTAKRRVKVLDQKSRTILTTLSKENQNELMIDGLVADQTYRLIFAPEGPSLSNFVQDFSTTLALRKLSFFICRQALINGIIGHVSIIDLRTS